MNIRAGVNLGRYQLLAEIGRGAMGMVYQALDPEIDRLVAIKTYSALDPNSFEAKEFRQRFATEARAAGRLAHPGIVTIYDRGEEPDTQTPYIVMEYVAGQPLSALLNNQSVRMEERFALDVARQIAEALAYAHDKGVIHRDIKPSNILLTEDGNAKIADFGVARVDMSNITSHGEVLGTPAYMSPEQLTGGEVDGRTDIFSLGVILYTMLSGFRPFQGNGASTIGFKVINQNPVPITSYHLDLSKNTEYIVARAMAKNPDERYAHAGLMATDLSDLLEGREPRSRHENLRPVNPDVIRVERDYRPFIAAVMPREKALPLKSSTTTGIGTDSAPARILNVPFALQNPAVLAPRSLVRVTIVAGCLIVASAAFAWINHAEAKALYAADRGLGLPPVLKEQLAAPPAPKKIKPVLRASSAATTIRQRNKPSDSPEPDSSLDRTVIHESPRPVPVNVAAIAPTPTASMNVRNKEVVQGRSANLQLSLEHHFRTAAVAVWVDDKLTFSGVSRGEQKKRLFGMRGDLDRRELHQIELPPGEHDIRVRVVSGDDHYDNSGIVHSTFADTQHRVLEIHCNKQGIELKLINGL